MARTLAILVFIAVVGVIGVAVGTRRTVIDGRVMAGNLLPELRKANPQVTAVECDREIPVGRDGSTFGCVISGDDGATLAVRYTMGRDGSLIAAPVERHHR